MRLTALVEKAFVLFLCGYMAVLPGCMNSDSPTNSEEAPEVPAFADILALDFFPFSNSNQPLQKADEAQTRNHFARAAFSVGLATLWVLVASSIPVIATAATVSVDPTLEPDGKFHWNYKHPSAANPIRTLELTAEIKGDVIEWNMFVTSKEPNPDFDNFLWYSGETRIGEEAGFLQFYDQNQAGESHTTVRADWDYEDDNNKTLSFLNNNTTTSRFNDDLAYSVVGDTVKVQYHNESASTSATVAWSRTSGAGYIEADDYNGGVRGNWDENQNDID